jgi:hypothetical protein
MFAHPLQVDPHKARALLTGSDRLDQGMALVAIIADGSVYMVEEFALSIVKDRGPTGGIR